MPVRNRFTEVGTNHSRLIKNWTESVNKQLACAEDSEVIVSDCDGLTYLNIWAVDQSPPGIFSHSSAFLTPRVPLRVKYLVYVIIAAAFYAFVQGYSSSHFFSSGNMRVKNVFWHTQHGDTYSIPLYSNSFLSSYYFPKHRLY